MAEVNGVVIFDGNHKIELSSTPDEIVNRIQGVTTPHIPLIELQTPIGGRSG